MNLNPFRWSRRAQLDIAWAIIVGVVLLLMAPILLHITTTITSSIGNATSAYGGAHGTNTSITDTTDYINSVLFNFWDFMTVIFFFVSILFLFISAYFVNMHPMFLIFYIISAIVIVLLLPGMQTMLNEAYGYLDVLNTTVGNNSYLGHTTITNMPMTMWVMQHLVTIGLVTIVLSGIIMYGKLSRAGQQAW